MVVVLENKDVDQVLGTGEAPYLDQLARAGAEFTNAHAETHPSQPNYLALFTGSTQGVTNDSCLSRLTAPNLATQLQAAGHSFVGYSESLPAPGYTGCRSGEYAQKHSPWAAFENVPPAANQPWSAWPASFDRLPTVALVREGRASLTVRHEGSWQSLRASYIYPARGSPDQADTPTGSVTTPWIATPRVSVRSSWCRRRGGTTAMDHLLAVEGATATSAVVTSLQEHSLLERLHLQEWVISNPSVLGDDVLVIASEYGSWAADADGAPAHDRLDVLGLDSSGRLVVVELKRGAATRDIHLQAITYAALVSRFTVDTLARAHREFLMRRGREVDLEEARSRLLDHVGDELDPELLRRPRLVLIATGFPKQVTHTVVWLSEMNVDIDLVEVSVWQVGDQLVAGFSRIYPIPEVDTFTLAPAREETATVKARVQQRTRSRNAVHLIVEAGLLPDGTRMRMVPGHGTTAAIRQEIAAWVEQDERRQWARWQNSPSKPLRWDFDGEANSATGIAERIFSEVTGRAANGIQGTAWWVLDDENAPPGADPEDWAALQGRTLVGLVEEVRPAQRDWSDLHEILRALPNGRWTSYGDLAAAIGSHAVPVGTPLAHCRTCDNAWRVLTAAGRVSAGFRWSDPDRADSPKDLLKADGVVMLGDVAQPSQRLRPDDLRALLDDET